MERRNRADLPSATPWNFRVLTARIVLTDGHEVWLWSIDPVCDGALVTTALRRRLRLRPHGRSLRECRDDGRRWLRRHGSGRTFERGHDPRRQRERRNG